MELSILLTHQYEYFRNFAKELISLNLKVESIKLYKHSVTINFNSLTQIIIYKSKSWLIYNFKNLEEKNNIANFKAIGPKKFVYDMRNIKGAINFFKKNAKVLKLEFMPNI